MTETNPETTPEVVPIDPATLPVGSIKRGPEAGRRGTGLFVTVACERCDARRWTQHLNPHGGAIHQPPKLCQRCNRKTTKYNTWQGG